MRACLVFMTMLSFSLAALCCSQADRQLQPPPKLVDAVKTVAYAIAFHEKLEEVKSIAHLLTMLPSEDGVQREQNSSNIVLTERVTGSILHVNADLDAWKQRNRNPDRIAVFSRFTAKEKHYVLCITFDTRIYYVEESDIDWQSVSHEAFLPPRTPS